MSKSQEDQTIAMLSKEVALLRKEIGHLKQSLVSRNSIEQIKTSAQAKIETIEPSLEHLKNDIESTIREQPSTAISIATGLGFLIGVLVRR